MRVRPVYSDARHRGDGERGNRGYGDCGSQFASHHHCGRRRNDYGPVSNTYAHANADAYPDCTSHTDSNINSHVDSDTHAQPNGNPHAKADSHSHPNPYAPANSNADSRSANADSRHVLGAGTESMQCV